MIVKIFLFALLLNNDQLVSAFDEPDPMNPSSCPSVFPGFSGSCSFDPSISCSYNPFSCTGSSEVSYTNICNCLSGSLSCLSADFDCGPSVTTPITTNPAGCPIERPAFQAPCTQTMTCNYEPNSCPGDAEPTYSTTCMCDPTVGFSCLSLARVPCPEDNPLPAQDDPMPSQDNPNRIEIPLSICFSGDSIVNVQGKGNIQMNTLRIGDKVHVGNDKYEPIYSFAHHAPQTLGDYLMIQTTESQHDHLKLSESHMILTPSGKHLPASNIMIGDEIVNGHGKNMIVESIKSVKSMGVFAPLTPSGKIVVNNVSASSFVAFGNDWGWKMKIVGGYEIGFSFHWMCHSFEFPHRLLCYYLGECVDEEYDEEGISMIWSSLPFGLMKWVMNQGLWLQYLCFVLTLMMVACFWLMETMMVKSPLMVACACCLAVAIGRRK